MCLTRPLLMFACLTGTALAQSAPPGGEAAGQGATRPLSPAPARPLDTLQLASAHRERAATVDEKTNGLWQSWTVSICEGCGDTPHYRATVRTYFVNGRRPAGLETGDEAARQRAALKALARDGAGRSLYTDLSTENIDRIRRMPGR